MNKYTVRIKMTLSVSPILKVLASLTKKSVFYKNRKQSKSIRTKNLFPKRKRARERIQVLAYYKLLIAKNVVVSLRRQ